MCENFSFSNITVLRIIEGSPYVTNPWRSPEADTSNAFITFDFGEEKDVWGVILSGNNGNWIKRFTVNLLFFYVCLCVKSGVSLNSEKCVRVLGLTPSCACDSAAVAAGEKNWKTKN